MSNPTSPSDENARKHFTSLLSGERLRIFGYIRALVPNLSDAEDIYQRVCITLWKKFDEFDPERDFFFWACGISFYTVCNHRRSVQSDRHYFSQELIESMSHRREQHLTNYNVRVDYLKECMNDLEEADQQLLKKATFEKQSMKDIARDFERSIQTLYNRLTLLRRELADCISRRLQSEQRT